MLTRPTPPRHAPAPTRRSSAARLGPFAFIAVGVLALVPAMIAAAAQAPIPLGAAQSFAVLAGAGITNTGSTTISGDVGTFPITAETGFDTVTLDGTDHGGDAVTQQAKTDLTTAYNAAAGATPTTAVATELGGSTLTPGVYGSLTLGITGTLTLDTLGDPNAVFVFKAGETLTTASSSQVVVLGGATACNVFWQVGSSAILGTDSTLIGSVLAEASITATTRAVIQGRLLARTGSVTLDTNTITRPTCAAASTTTASDGTPGVAPAAPVSGGVMGAPSGGGATGAGSGSGSSLTGGGAAPDRPGLPATGPSATAPLLGITLIAAGLALVGASRAQRPRHLAST